jgi:hypothetical protein
MARSRILNEPQQSEPIMASPNNTTNFTPGSPANMPAQNALLAAMMMSRRRRRPGAQPTAPLPSGGLGANQPRVGYYG